MSSQYGRKPKISRRSPVRVTAAWVVTVPPVPPGPARARPGTHRRGRDRADPAAVLVRDVDGAARDGRARAGRGMRRRGRVEGPERAAVEAAAGKRGRGRAAHRPPALARGVNATATRPPTRKLVRSLAWASACSYWIDGWSPAVSGASRAGGVVSSSAIVSVEGSAASTAASATPGSGASSGARTGDGSTEPARARSGTAAAAGGTSPASSTMAVRPIAARRGSRNRGRWNAVSKRRSSSDPPRRRGDGPCRVDRHVSTRRSRLPVGIVHPAVKHDHPTMVPVRCRTVGCGAVPRRRAEPRRGSRPGGRGGHRAPRGAAAHFSVRLLAVAWVRPSASFAQTFSLSVPAVPPDLRVTVSRHVLLSTLLIVRIEVERPG